MRARDIKSKELLASIATGGTSATDVLMDLTEEQLNAMLSPTFAHTGSEPLVGKGEGILPGDISGQLLVDRELGERLLEEAEARRTEIDLIYSPPSGNLEDFRVLQASRGFFTDEGETTFCAVQAGNEGVPAIVDADCSYEERPEHLTIAYQFRDEGTLDIEQHIRSVTFSHDGRETEVFEAEFVSMSGSTGEVFREKIDSIHPTNVMRAHRLLARCYAEALDRFGPREAETRLVDTNVFDENRDWLLDAIDSKEFQGFKTLARTARGAADLKVYSTAHTPEAMALTRMLGSEFSLEANGKLRIEADESDYGLGLLRDERMWSEPEDIDLLRLILLGPDIVGDGYRQFEEAYLDTFSRMVYGVLRALPQTTSTG